MHRKVLSCLHRLWYTIRPILRVRDRFCTVKCDRSDRYGCFYPKKKTSTVVIMFTSKSYFGFHPESFMILQCKSVTLKSLKSYSQKKKKKFKKFTGHTKSKTTSESPLACINHSPPRSMCCTLMLFIINVKVNVTSVTSIYV